MPNLPLVSHEAVPEPRRPYEPPRLTVHGTVAELTQDPQSRPRAEGSTLVELSILYRGEDA